MNSANRIALNIFGNFENKTSCTLQPSKSMKRRFNGFLVCGRPLHDHDDGVQCSLRITEVSVK